MAEIVIGRTLDRVRIKIIKDSQQAFALAWTDSAGNPADISAISFTIQIDIPPASTVTWTAAKSTNVTTWTVSPTDSALPRGYYSGELMAGAEVAYSVIVEVQ